MTKHHASIVFGTCIALFAACGAEAAVTISTNATQNMSCVSGVCTPTASNANLNIGDLESLLGSGNLTVTTTGSGAEAGDLDINAGIEWANSNTLSLKAYRTIEVTQPIAVNGAAGLTIMTNNGGSGGLLSFAAGASASFLDLSSALTINGTSYILVNSVQSLANSVAANSSGAYALASNYDAGGDGTYVNSPIPTFFHGSFEGLGNSISNLSLKANSTSGLFAELEPSNGQGGLAENIVLRNITIGGKGDGGGLAGINNGTISGAFVSGSIATAAGGGLLVVSNAGVIARSGTSGTITGNRESGFSGCLAEGNTGTVVQSYGNCTISAKSDSIAGGLVAENVNGSINQCYAAGSVHTGGNSYVGGLVGDTNTSDAINQSYSTTAVKMAKGTGGDKGGLIGLDRAPAGSNSSDYWDTSTSGVANLKHGAGSPKNDPGITGLTSAQLQSGLPAGFDPTVWAENPNINNGFPYLIANPPR